MKFIGSALKNLTALLIGCIFALLIAEGVLQFYNPFDFRVKGNKIVLPANKKYVMKKKGYFSRPPKLSGNMDDVIVHTKNSLGFRGSEPPEHLRDYLTIITIGGSTTECTYLSDGRTWTDVLEKRLRNDFERLWINNAGFDGHSTFGHQILIEDYILKLKPNVVLFLVGANDQGREDPGEYDKEVMKNKIIFHSLNGFVKSMANHSEVFSLGVNLYRYTQANLIGVGHREINFHNYKKMRLHQFAREEQERREEEIQINSRNSLKGYKKRLEDLVHILKKNGITPVFITQPTLYGDFILGDEGVKITHGKDLMYLLELYNNVTRRVGSESDVLVIDLAAELPKNSKYYYDYYHFTNKGAEKVAEIIYIKLNNYLKQRLAQYLPKQ